MRILVTGHKGYIGTHLFQELDNAEGCDLKDGHDFADIRGETYDVVYHLAAVSSVMESIRDPKNCFSNNVWKLIQFLQSNKIGRFVFASTGGALYGNRRQAKESDAVFDNCISPYGQSKYMAEEAIGSIHPNAISLRLGNVIGGNDGLRIDSLVHYHFRNDNPIIVYGGNQIRDFVTMNVVCSAFTRAAKSKITGAFNIASGTETRISDLAEGYYKARTVPVIYKPAREGEIECISLDCAKARQAGLL